MVNGDLTDKQRRFIDEYLIDLNATQAAIRAGYSEASATVTACQNLMKPNIINEVMRRQEARQKRTEVTQDMVVQELARIAFFDPATMYDEDGQLLSIVDMPEDTRRAIGGIDVHQFAEDNGFTIAKKIKIIDKKGSLDLLGKHMKMFTDKVDLNVSGTLTMADAIRQRDAKTNS